MVSASVPDQALVASQSIRQGVSTEGFDPSRGELGRMVDELLDPLRGVERGLLAEDADALLLNIRVGELRKVARCLRLTARILLNEETERAA